VGGPLAPRCTHVGIAPRVDRLAPHLHAALLLFLCWFTCLFSGHAALCTGVIPPPTLTWSLCVGGWAAAQTYLWGSLPQHSHASVRAFGPRPHPNHIHVHAFPVGRSTYRTSLFCQQHNQPIKDTPSTHAAPPSSRWATAWGSHVPRQAARSDAPRYHTPRSGQGAGVCRVRVGGMVVCVSHCFVLVGTTLRD